MPDFKLTPDEASALADFLLAPREVRRGSGAQPVPEGDPDQGRALVADRGCLNCHQLDLPNRYRAPDLDEIVAGDLEGGCLSLDPATEAEHPRYSLRPGERSDLQAFLKEPGGALDRHVPAEFAGRWIRRQRCQACHQMDGAADTWSRWRAQQESPPSWQELARALGREEEIRSAQRRPMLTWQAEKLTREWLVGFLEGTVESKPRPSLLARMPAFPLHAAELVEGLRCQHGLPLDDPVPAPPDPERVMVGERLVAPGTGLSCVTCHALGGQPPRGGAAVRAVDLRLAGRRTRPEFFFRWIKNPQRIDPGTMMPDFGGEDGKTGITDLYDGDADRQFQAIWDYLRR